MKQRKIGPVGEHFGAGRLDWSAVVERGPICKLLSPGEKQFVELLAAGHSYGQIARSMNISINTVRDYVRSAYKKLNVNSRTQAVVKYLGASLNLPKLNSGPQ